jgi:hypothetical protein
MNKNKIKVSTGGVTITLFNKWVFVFFAKMITLEDLLKEIKRK